MPPQHDTEILHQRISEVRDIVTGFRDELKGEISLLAREVRASNDLCKICRPHVIGNGKPGMVDRMARLEEARIENGESRITALETTGRVSAWYVTKIIAAASAVVGVLSVAVTVVMHMIEKGAL